MLDNKTLKEEEGEGYSDEFIISSWPNPGILVLSLNRPSLNAFSTSFWRSLSKKFLKIKKDRSVRVVIISSELEKVFTVGLDLKDDDLKSIGDDPARTALILRNHILEFQSAISTIEDCERPVIAAIHGKCIGLGIDIITACDIRLIDSESLLSIREVELSIAADIGTLQRLPKKTGNDSLVRELALTGRDFGVREAVEIGLVSEDQVTFGGKDSVLDRAIQLAKTISEKSPVAILGIKHLLNYSRDHSTEEGLKYTAIWNSFALQAVEVRESIENLTSSKTSKEFKKLKFKGLPKL